MIDYGFGVKLRPLSLENAQLYFEWRNTPSVYAWCRQIEPLNWQNHIKWLESVPDRKDVRFYEVVSSGEPSGVCGFTDIDHINRRAEFSLYIDPKKHGRGLGKCALRTLFHHGFYTLNLNRIWGETFDSNPAFNIFLSLGMQHEGRRLDFYFRNGEYIDCNLVSINLDEFKKCLNKSPQPVLPISDK
jgi:RimJ/RimL family protein N-acetyltransferase